MKSLGKALVSVSRVTSKGQITIGASLRARLGIKQGDQMLMSLQEDGSIRLVRVPPMKEVLKTLPFARVRPEDTVPASEMDEVIDEALAEQALAYLRHVRPAI